MENQSEKPKGFISVPKAAQTTSPKRDFTFDPPEGPTGTPGPSKKSKEDFEALAQAREDHIEQTKQVGAQEAADGEKGAQTELEKATEDDPLDLDVFGLDPDRRKFLASLIGPEQKKRAAKGSTPLKMGDLGEFGEFRQTVTIVSAEGDDPGMRVTFRTLSSKENLYIQEMLSKYENHTLAYVNELQLLCILACCVKAVNDESIPGHLVKGEVDKGMFKQKLNKIMSFPVQVSAMLSTHCAWFDERVRKRFLMGEMKEDIKNG